MLGVYQNPANPAKRLNKGWIAAVNGEDAPNRQRGDAQILRIECGNDGDSDKYSARNP